ncbi:UbiA family prenyltransferase [Kibdelosporangium philippinense]|uniref:UbiA family prenyltransferase n=2 Tax=Kibdelosporangium philippinense TaxID=211113 RepID=A0ABS8Z491_9PSEU|nr:UbiA family prenyltransferase [Kibdelosporangium philippinense]MCE7002297.1 UbiA family prenyltransferase [Kibdelosporangium philippinense]
MYALRFLVGVSMTVPVTGLWNLSTLTGLAAWVPVVAAIYLINGIADIEGDQRNGSKRPIATGALSVEAAWRAVGWLVLFGLSAAALVSYEMVALSLVMLAVGWAYSCGPWPLKNTVAGVLIGGSVLGFLTYLAGFVATPGGVLSVDFLVLAGGLSLWMGVVGGFTKDLKDVPGDRAAGRRTLPVRLGVRRAAVVAAVVAVVFALLYAGLVSSVAVALVPHSIGLFLGALAVAAIAGQPPGEGRTVPKWPYRAFMITQYFANLLAVWS